MTIDAIRVLEDNNNSSRITWLRISLFVKNMICVCVCVWSKRMQCNVDSDKRKNNVVTAAMERISLKTWLVESDKQQRENRYL